MSHYSDYVPKLSILSRRQGARTPGSPFFAFKVHLRSNIGQWTAHSIENIRATLNLATIDESEKPATDTSDYLTGGELQKRATMVGDPYTLVFTFNAPLIHGEETEEVDVLKFTDLCAGLTLQFKVHLEDVVSKRYFGSVSLPAVNVSLGWRATIMP